MEGRAGLDSPETAKKPTLTFPRPSMRVNRAYKVCKACGPGVGHEVVHLGRAERIESFGRSSLKARANA